MPVVTPQRRASAQRDAERSIATCIARVGLVTVMLASIFSSRVVAQGKALPVDTTRWVRVVQDVSRGSSIFTDTTTMRVAGDTITVWVLEQLSHPRRQLGHWITKSLIRTAFDCAHDRLHIVQAVYYNGNSQAYDLSESEAGVVGHDEWRAVVPESTGELEARFVCSFVHRDAPHDRR